MRQDLVQPLQGTVEMQLDPAGSAGHRLPPATNRGWGAGKEINNVNVTYKPSQMRKGFTATGAFFPA